MVKKAASFFPEYRAKIEFCKNVEKSLGYRLCFVKEKAMQFAAVLRKIDVNEKSDDYRIA